MFGLHAMSVHCVSAWCPWRVEWGLGSHGTGITDVGNQTCSSGNIVSSLNAWAFPPAHDMLFLLLHFKACSSWVACLGFNLCGHNEQPLLSLHTVQFVEAGNCDLSLSDSWKLQYWAEVMRRRRRWKLPINDYCCIRPDRSQRWSFSIMWDCPRHTLYVSQAIFNSYIELTGPEWLPFPCGQMRFPRILLFLLERLMYVAGRRNPGSEHLVDSYVRQLPPPTAPIITLHYGDGNRNRFFKMWQKLFCEELWAHDLIESPG